MRTTETHQLFLDSRDAVEGNGPFEKMFYLNNPNKKSANSGSFKNVSEISILAFAMPKVANEHYVYVDLGSQLNNTIYGSDEGITDQIAGVFFFDSGALATGTVKPQKGSDFTPKKVVFEPFVTEIDRIPIRILKHGGEAVSAMDVAPGQAEFSMLISITTNSRPL
jgi:hypothetical protein